MTADTAALAAQMTDWLAGVRARAVRSGTVRPFSTVDLHINDDGGAYLIASGQTIGRHDIPLAETMARADAWADGCDIEATNLTLGLTADGRLPEHEAA